LEKIYNLVIYQDSEIKVLNIELQNKKLELQTLEEIKVQYKENTNRFSYLYNQKLGEFIQQMLYLKKEISYQKISKNRDMFEKSRSEYQFLKVVFQELESQKIEIEQKLKCLINSSNEYLKVKKEYLEIQQQLEEKEHQLNLKKADFEKAKNELENKDLENQHNEDVENYEDILTEDDWDSINENDIYADLTKDELNELRSVYKKSMKICHPDIVSINNRVEAVEITKNLNYAYSVNNLQGVIDIYEHLLSDSNFTTLTDKDLLKLKITKFQDRVDETREYLQSLRDDEDFFGVASNPILWQQYFEKEQEILEKEIQNLHRIKGGSIYEKFIGKEYEKREELVIYNGFIRSYEDQGVDLISISDQYKTINLIQCKNWTTKDIYLEDIELIHEKLNNYDLDYIAISHTVILKFLQIKYNFNIKKIQDVIKRSTDYQIIKTLYIGSEKVINSKIWKNLKIDIKHKDRYKFKDLDFIIKPLKG